MNLFCLFLPSCSRWQFFSLGAEASPSRSPPSVCPSHPFHNLLQPGNQRRVAGNNWKATSPGVYHIKKMAPSGTAVATAASPGRLETLIYYPKVNTSKQITEMLFSPWRLPSLMIIALFSSLSHQSRSSDVLREMGCSRLLPTSVSHKAVS